MTGAQLKKLRQVNGLSERQFAKVLGFERDVSRSGGNSKRHASRAVNPVRKIQKLEEKTFVPEPIVHRINEMVAEGKLVAR